MTNKYLEKVAKKLGFLTRLTNSETPEQLGLIYDVASSRAENSKPKEADKADKPKEASHGNSKPR